MDRHVEVKQITFVYLPNGKFLINGNAICDCPKGTEGELICKFCGENLMNTFSIRLTTKALKDLIEDQAKAKND